MKNHLTYFLLFFTMITGAQVPGYLGMKNSFGYVPNVSVAYQFINSDFHTSTLFLNREGGFGGPLQEWQLKPFALNISHTFTYDRIVNRHGSLVTTFSFFKSGVYLDSVYTGTFNPSTSNFDYATYKGGNTKMTGFAGTLSYRSYRNDLAPLGLYAGWFIGFASASAVTHASITDSTVVSKVHAITPKFGYAYGRQNVFFDKIIIDRGFSFDILGLISGALKKRSTPQNFNTNSWTTDPGESFTRQMKIRMYYRDFLTFFIGAKYMF